MFNQFFNAWSNANADWSDQGRRDFNRVMNNLITGNNWIHRKGKRFELRFIWVVIAIATLIAYVVFLPVGISMTIFFGWIAFNEYRIANKKNIAKLTSQTDETA